MDTEESNFRFFFLKKELPYIQTYIKYEERCLLKRNNYSHEQLFQKQNINNLKQN